MQTAAKRISRPYCHALVCRVLAGYGGAALLVAYPSGAQSDRTTEWITVNKDYSSQRYVDLDQITPANVGALKEVCELQLNEPAFFNSGMLMVGRTIYVDTLRSTYAVDATTCDLRWRNDIAFVTVRATNFNRGPAYLDGMIFRGTADGRIMALNAMTGGLVWQTQAADPGRRESFLSAPIAWNNKVYIGIGISDAGVRGRLMAFDARTGKELWRFNTIPIGIEPGAETWHTTPGVSPAGGGFWASYSLDPATGEVFAPVANPFPDFVAAQRSGENLYTNSVISLDAVTGKLNWYNQLVAGDDHDWDVGTPPTLYRTLSGKTLLAIAGKSGIVTGIDRASKTAIFKTLGTTNSNTERVDETLKLVCPGASGGAEWNGTAYHPGLGILYTGMVDWCFYYSTKDYSGEPGFWVGREVSGEAPTIRPDFSKPAHGWISAMDGETGKVLWKYEADAAVVAGLTPTKGGILLGGDVRGNLLALDARNGNELKRIDVKGALNHGLISYAVDGNQYVAAAVGGLSYNARGISGPLRVSIYSLKGSATPKIVKLARAPITPVPATGAAANQLAFASFCGPCHSPTGKEGAIGPPLVRHSELGDPEVLKTFLSAVPPPMPVVYPGLLEDKDVEMIAGYLKTLTTSENPHAPAAYKQPTTDGSLEWKAIYSVLTSPRCINCHTLSNYPRQTDMRYPHIYSVVRGVDDHGAPVARCSMCHGDENNTATGVPGRSDWHIAPIAMAWESAAGISMTGPELCVMLKDRLRNGNRDLAQLVEHVETEHLVLWAWDPGARWNGEARKKPPLSHEEFVNSFRAWVAAGAPCPTR